MLNGSDTAPASHVHSMHPHRNISKQHHAMELKSKGSWLVVSD
jgi:hypothetical protein